MGRGESYRRLALRPGEFGKLQYKGIRRDEREHLQATSLMSLASANMSRETLKLAMLQGRQASLPAHPS